MTIRYLCLLQKTYSCHFVHQKYYTCFYSLADNEDLPLAKVKREYKEQFKTEDPTEITDQDDSSNIKDEPMDYDGEYKKKYNFHALTLIVYFLHF